MSFSTDKQTLEDLNLLGKYKQHSIFSLFNKVITPGGEKLLSAMFQHPLSYPDEINRRSSVFRYFQQKALTFPFSSDQFTGMTTFLEGSSGNSYFAVQANLFRKKVLSDVVKDAEYDLIKVGLQQTIDALTDGNKFLENFTDGDIDNPCFTQVEKLKKLLGDKRLQELKEQAVVDMWGLPKVARYVYLLRSVLRSELEYMIEAFQEIDVYIAVGNLAASHNFTYARAQPDEQNILTASELRYPAMNKAVANTVSLQQENNLIFLTGANMAGKSTLMKTFGIAVYLAHMGFPVAAKEMSFSVKQGIWTSINVPDNLDKGLSHFYAEVLRVKTVAEEVSQAKNLVIIFDELFKGTNVKDAYDATLTITAAFADYRNCLFIISTHIVEAGEALQKEKENIRFLYLPTVMEGKVPTYTYKLQQGISADRHGMMIIENEGILDMLETKYKTII